MIVVESNGRRFGPFTTTVAAEVYMELYCEDGRIITGYRGEMAKPLISNRREFGWTCKAYSEADLVMAS